MDNREDQPIGNRALDPRSEDEAALVVFRRLVSETALPAAGVLARGGDLEMRYGDPAAGALHLARAADRYAEAGLRNLALAVCHRLLQLDPAPTDEYLRLGELSAAQGYARDARLGYVEYAERSAGAGEVDAARAALQAYLRFAPADAAVQRRLAELSGDAPESPAEDSYTPLDTPPLDATALDVPQLEAPLPPPAPLEGLERNEPVETSELPTLLDQAVAPEPADLQVAPLEGLESNRADDDWGAAGLPDEPVDALPLLGFDSDVDSAVEELPRVAAPEGEGGEEPSQDEGVEEDLPLLGSDTLPLLQPQAGEVAIHDRAALVAECLELGRRYEADLDLPRARESFERALELDPENPAARRALAVLAPPTRPTPDYVDLGALVLSGDADLPDEIRAEIDQPVGIDARDLEGILELFEGKIARVIDSNDAASHYDLGLAFKEMGLYDDAVAHLQAALRTGASPLATLEVLGECFIEDGDPAFATRLLERAAQLRDAEPAELVGVLYWLGRGYEELKDSDRARAAYERLLAQSSDFRDAATRLAAL